MPGDVQDELEQCSMVRLRPSDADEGGWRASGLIAGEWIGAGHAARTPEGALDALRVAVAKWTSPEERERRAKDLAMDGWP